VDPSEFEVVVTRKRTEAADIATFELKRIDGSPLPAFSAGSHIDVWAPDGQIRQYSLCNHPDERGRYEIGVLRSAQGRGGSRAMHDEVNEGDVLRISAPKNHFNLAHDAQRSLLLAGGIGVTPILCMAERLATIKADFSMHYCVRSPDHAAFRARIQNSGFSQSVVFHFSRGEPASRLDVSSLLAAEDDGRTHLYVCGRRSFMDSVIGEARRLGWEEQRLHFEYFAGQSAASSGDVAFQVKLASSGLSVTVPPGSTVVQALADAGVAIATSCEQGVCGTCVTRVLAGEIDHRDLFLSKDEQAANDRFTPCCSRSRSSVLLLDL
jgi:vanillate O-demethylase ferredoxin subunit